MPLLSPLPPETTPELAETFAHFKDILGVIPNSLLTLQRKPEVVKAFGLLTESIMSHEHNQLDPGFKRLLAHFASSAAGCQYCQAHSILAAGISGIESEKLEALWNYPESDLFSEQEKAAFDFALAAGSVPNGVDKTISENLRKHWSEDEIAEMLAAICLYGFLNRWNDSMATTLESSPIETGQQFLSGQGWTGGKHRP